MKKRRVREGRRNRIRDSNVVMSPALDVKALFTPRRHVKEDVDEHDIILLPL